MYNQACSWHASTRTDLIMRRNSQELKENYVNRCLPFRWQLYFMLGGWKFNNYVKFYGEKVELNNPKQQYLKYNEIQSYWYNFMVVKLSMAVLKKQQGLVFQKPLLNFFSYNLIYLMITLQHITHNTAW